jgi:hypothetical protein
MLKASRFMLAAILVAASVAAIGAQTAKKSTKASKTHPRVFFVEPKNGATVTSPVHLKFGSSGTQISPVPPGEVTKVRPGMTHYHVGIDQKCLPAGKTIVKGTPSWVHFGKGEAEFDTQLTPGKHTLALQLGDDLHNTVAGACSVITVNVK